jgi:hypothetical protein
LKRRVENELVALKNIEPLSVYFKNQKKLKINKGSISASLVVCLGNHVSHAQTTVVMQSVSTLVAICSSLFKRRKFFQWLPLGIQ